MVRPCKFMTLTYTDKWYEAKVSNIAHDTWRDVGLGRLIKAK